VSWPSLALKQERKYISLKATACYFHLEGMLTFCGNMPSMHFLKKNMMAKDEFQSFCGEKHLMSKKNPIVHPCSLTTHVVMVTQCMFKIGMIVVIEIETGVDMKIIEESEAEVEIETLIKETEINQKQKLSVVKKTHVLKKIILFANTVANAEIDLKVNANGNIRSKPLKQR
jgi:hypothetical protein